MKYNLKGGVLIIGSLFWQDDRDNGDGIRKQWRTAHLDMNRSINVSMPIRYGRFSSANAYTMIFDNTMSIDKHGIAKAVPFKTNPNSWEQLKFETERLSQAEGTGKRFIKWSPTMNEAWCICSICFNPKVDSQLKSDILNNWGAALNESQAGYLYFAQRPEKYCLTLQGELLIPWPRESDAVDYLIATSTQPRNRGDVPLLTIQEIANHVSNRDYFRQNMRHGITTYQDESISKILS